MQPNIHAKSKVTSTQLAPVDALLKGADAKINHSSIGGLENTQPASSEAEHVGYQGFFIGKLGFLTKLSEGNLLAEVPRIYRLPNSSEWFLGYVNLHGNLIPVFDLSLYLGVKEGVLPLTDKKKRLLVLLQKESSAGFLIDDLPKRVNLTGYQEISIETAPHKIRAHISNAHISDSKSIWFNLDVHSLANSLEDELAIGG